MSHTHFRQKHHRSDEDHPSYTQKFHILKKEDYMGKILNSKDLNTVNNIYNPKQPRFTKQSIRLYLLCVLTIHHKLYHS